MASDLHSTIGIFIASIRNPQTARAYSKALARFEQVAPAELSRVDETYLPPFANSLEGLSVASIQLYLNAAISFFAFLIVTKQSEAVNLDRARLVKQKLIGRAPKRISNHNMADVQALVEYVKGMDCQKKTDRLSLIALRDRALILALAETGLRRSEAAGLKLSAVDLEAGQAVVIGKGDKQAIVYFGPASLAAIREYIEARPEKKPSSPLFMRHSRGGKAWTRDPEHLDGTSINNSIKLRAREALGHGNISPHALRHYFVTSVWRKTHDLMLAKELARHESVLTTQRYTHVDDDQLKDAHRRVFG